MQGTGVVGTDGVVLHTQNARRGVSSCATLGKTVNLSVFL
jgi:hypothetical protein